MFAVSEQKNLWLRQRLQELGVSERDFEEQFIRSSGPGGQHVNKTSTAVQLKHLPSGRVVRVDRERSQSANRFLARRELLEQLAVAAGLQPARQSKQDKQRKQKLRRSRRSRATRQSTEPHDS